ncbi:heme exporter protein CcmD [Hydrogenophaga sp. R2]|uniref:heme exporter protein CcmD n=1 Tax=Hydrogenophaga sp. R2 TaxID=3132827 RepID=UPI003CF42B35
MNTLADFLAMNGHGLYVWGSLGMCAAVLVAEVALLRLRRRLLERAVTDELDDAVAAPERNTLHGGRA